MPPLELRLQLSKLGITLRYLAVLLRYDLILLRYNIVLFGYRLRMFGNEFLMVLLNRFGKGGFVHKRGVGLRSNIDYPNPTSRSTAQRIGSTRGRTG